MPTWVAFLRAVNVGNRTYPMARLRAALTAAGFEDVETHIQTGNVKVRTALRSRAKVEKLLEKTFAADIGLDVPTFAMTPDELSELAEAADELGGLHQPTFGHYVSILREVPSAADRDTLEDLRREGELVVVRGRAIHLLYDIPYHQAKTSNATLERIVSSSTNRNARVITALAKKWGS